MRYSFFQVGLLNLMQYFFVPSAEKKIKLNSLLFSIKWFKNAEKLITFVNICVFFSYEKLKWLKNTLPYFSINSDGWFLKILGLFDTPSNCSYQGKWSRATASKVDEYNSVFVIRLNKLFEIIFKILNLMNLNRDQTICEIHFSTVIRMNIHVPLWF